MKNISTTRPTSNQNNAQIAWDIANDKRAPFKERVQSYYFEPFTIFEAYYSVAMKMSSLNINQKINIK